MEKGKKYPHLWGPKNKLWKGGSLTNNGYLSVRIGRKYKLLHRYLMEIHLKRNLLSTEEIHHKDGNKLNNDIYNLELIDKSSHRRLHIGHLNKPGIFYNRWKGKWEKIKDGI